MTPTLREVETGATEEQKARHQAKILAPPPAMEEQAPAPAPGPGLGGFIWAKTGPGEPEEYLSHPLNLPRSLGLARVIRGVTGLALSQGVDGLDFALVDIGIGLLIFTRERMPAVEPGELAGRTGP